jgi:malate dehydrogenase (oxaloacetate-decarboxylating)
MEGKAILFKEFGNVDAVPLCIDTQDTEDIITFCRRIAPTSGGINLEDISAPRCFEIEDRLRQDLEIPVFHDDQHGTAVVVLAGLVKALRITGRPRAHEGRRLRGRRRGNRLHEDHGGVAGDDHDVNLAPGIPGA